MKSKELLVALKHSETEFISLLKAFLREKGINVKKLSKISKIPLNTLYKLLSNPKKDFRVSMLRKLCNAVDKIEGPKGKFVAVISPRVSLNQLKMKSLKIGNVILPIKEYAVITIEDVMVQAIKAQKQGAVGLVCGPMAAFHIKDMVDIPISSSILDGNDLEKALLGLKNKIFI